jgi:nifR3 family TIM-barrel protein
MRIRELDLPGVARLAPMAGISNAPFRLLTRECGSAFTTSEEIDAISLVRGSAAAHDIVRMYPGERPIAYQLLGSDADLLARAAELVQEAGADIVDLNMGCPVPKITRQGKGAALMRDVPATARIIRTLRNAVRVPLTVKIRGGWDDEHLNAVEVARMAEDEGVDAIAVHPRTRSQRFHGRAPWQIIADVVAAVRVPVTGNGDITSMAEARRMMAETGCAAVMIGRGALGRPWVFDERFETLDPAARWRERARIIRRHLALIEDHFAANPRYALNQMRKHLGWYVPSGMPYANRAQNAVHMARTPEEAKAAFWEWWDAAAPPAAPDDSPAPLRRKEPALA